MNIATRPLVCPICTLNLHANVLHVNYATCCGSLTSGVQRNEYRFAKDFTPPIDERGSECEDGWFEIIDQLSSACEAEIEALGDGLENSKWPRVSQIKEKFGSLRFRATGAVSAELRKRFSCAEVASRHICEKCGEPGRLRKKIGLRTYCDSCENAYEASLAHKRITFLLSRGTSISNTAI